MSGPRGRRITSALVVAAAALTAVPLSGFLLFGGNVKWKTLPVRYFITNRDVPGVTANQLRTAVDQAFQTWTGQPTVVLSSEFAGIANLEPDVEDLINVIGFQAHPEQERVLGLTDFHTDTITDQLIEADIFLNTTFPWSVAANGEAGRFDVQSIATHEIGHLFGLGHSALGETSLLSGGGRLVIAKRAVMFPIAYPPGNIDDRRLKPDDAAAISSVYPTAEFERKTGAVTGRVRLNGAGIFGAHVEAINQSNGNITAGFSLDSSGRFTVGGLEPGIYLIRVEPLDDADVNSFFGSQANVNRNFRVTYFERLVGVPAGGAGAAVDINVVPK